MQGSAYDDKRDEDHAIADHDRAIKIDPTLDLAFNNRANAYGRKGEIDDAIADYDEAIRLNPRFSAAYNNRGNTYREDKRDYVRAIADYDNVIAINPRDTGALSNRGHAHFYRGDFVDAAADLSRVLETDFDTYSSLFRFLAQSRAGQAAFDIEPAATRMNSRNWPYAVFELYLGRRDAAATLAAAQKPDERCEAQFYVGEWQLLQGDRAAAKQRFEEAVGICPKLFIEYTGAQAELRRLGP